MSLRALHPAGVALLLFSGSDHRLTVPNPDEGRPGIKCTQFEGDPGVVLIKAEGWPDRGESLRAILQADVLLQEAGFATEPYGDASDDASLVRRRS